MTIPLWIPLSIIALAVFGLIALMNIAIRLDKLKSGLYYAEQHNDITRKAGDDTLGRVRDIEDGLRELGLRKESSIPARWVRK